MAKLSLAHLLVLLPFLSTATTAFSSNQTHQTPEKFACLEEERQALLTFKDGLRSPNNSSLPLSSWVGSDCCNWMGVGCNNTTGHVVRLDLHDASIDVPNESGELNTSLLELNHLEYLDLSNNSFGFSPIPKIFGSFKKLKYLNLSCALFGGVIPTQLGNLSHLQSLDLSDNYLKVNDFRWVSNLSSLKYLDMGGVNLSRANDWFQVTNLLPSLSTLRLSYCSLRNLPAVTHPNWTTLTHLDLSGNGIDSKFPSWLVNLTHLEFLDLSANTFEGSLPDSFVNLSNLEYLGLVGSSIKGPIPRSIGCLCNLQVLDLRANKMQGDVNGFLQSLSKCCSDDLENDRRSSSMRKLDLGSNNFSGTVPESVGQLSKLEHLDFSSNNFSGIVPESVWQLSELVLLDLSKNSLEGIIYEAHFANLTRLETLRLSGNSLVFNVSEDWIPPSKLEFIELRSCRLGPKFPRWLWFLKDYSLIDLSKNQISDPMPTWFWNLSSKATHIDLSSNNISGKIPTSSEFYTSSEIGRIINLSSNRFEGFQPYHVSKAHIISGVGVYYSITILDASNNSLSGSIPSSWCDIQFPFYLDLSNNQIIGQIPSCFGNISYLGNLNLENNNLTGQIPSSIAKLTNLMFLNLSNNSLNGTIPRRFESYVLSHLLLSNNHLHGVLPLSFANPTNLVAIDLSKNRLSGSLKICMWESLTQLRFLNLRSNMFHGNIPPQLSQLASLQVLDLADNHLSGVIPSSFSNFTAMERTHNLSEVIGYLKLSMIVKGIELEFTRIIGLWNIIDLSRNGLSGEIPTGLVRLTGLNSLNLSGNHLEGSIPRDIGNLQHLESLDFSRNHLFGTIPSSISALNFLTSLNLSYNNLSGHIPLGRQLQTFTNSSYTGNYNLCGPPLSKMCPDHVPQVWSTPNGGDAEDESKLQWFFLGFAPGFVVGFWSIFGALMINRRWRIAFFRLVDRLNDSLNGLFVFMIVKFIKE